MKQNVNTTLYPYLLFWLLINLVQSQFTELFHDEALYWVCSQHLDWGFWDHPPAAPFLIWLGYGLIHSELGVRLFIVLASVLTLFGIWRLVRPADNRLFFALVFSIFIVHIGGFMAAPDIPLLLFSTWFLVAYREYIQHDRWSTAMILGLLVAGMAYSKYHGAIILFFVLLSNLKLLRRQSFWVIPVIALVLFFPHLYWQWVHGFPTFRYHLIDRAGDSYKWTFISDYLGGQLLVLGPFSSILLLWAAFRYRAKSDLERSLKWALWGVLGFFLFQSFSQRTEANWTAVAVVPLIYLAYRYIEDKPRWRKWSFRLAIPSLLIFLVFRLYLMVDFLPAGMNPRNEVHGWKKWALDIRAVAGDRPVVFYNTYRKPSKYSFYAHRTGISINKGSHAGNQYDLVPEMEESLQGKEVLLVDKRLNEGVTFTPGGLQDLQYRIVDDFRSFNRVKVQVLDAPRLLPADTMLQLTIDIFNPTDHPIRFQDGKREVSLRYLVFLGDETALEGSATSALPTKEISPGTHERWNVSLRTPHKPGEYRYRFGFQVEGFSAGRNGPFNPLCVVGKVNSIR
ncbi:MAG: glycosyltransferase family 39 protein [Lewinellaceae bacterium]|nr:glycosyltransferase family 39 protein [Lewinellaceae bacterium]